MIQKLNRPLYSDQSGQAMVEFTIIFLILFLFILLILQTTLLVTARQMVHYSAFCSARSVIVHMNNEDSADDYYETARRAAAMATIPVVPAFSMKVPMASAIINRIQQVSKHAGNGLIYAQKYYFSWRFLTKVDVLDSTGKSLVFEGKNKKGTLAKVDPGKPVTVEVTHYYILRIPLINRLFYEAYYFNKLDTAVGFKLSGTIKKVQNALSINISLPIYWFPISARCTMTVQGEMDGVL